MRLDDVGDNAVILGGVAALVVLVAFLATVFVQGSIVSPDTTLSVHGCTTSEDGGVYTFAECSESNNVLSGKQVSYFSDQASLSEFDLLGDGHYYTRWTEAYLVENGYPGSEFVMECSDETFADDGREMDFCTNNDSLAEKYIDEFDASNVAGNKYSEGTIRDATGYDYVLRTGFPGKVRSALRSQSECTATLSGYDGGTAVADGVVTFTRAETGGEADGLACTVTLPSRYDGVSFRGFGYHQITWTIDADFSPVMVSRFVVSDGSCVEKEYEEGSAPGDSFDSLSACESSLEDTSETTDGTENTTSGSDDSSGSDEVDDGGSDEESAEVGWWGRFLLWLDQWM